MTKRIIFNRIFASIFDIFVLFGLAFIVSIPSIACLLNVLSNNSTANIVASFVSSFISGCVSVILIVFYSIVFPAKFEGQTLGMIFFNIKIVKINGGDVDFKVMFIRNTFHLLTIFVTLGFTLIIDLLTLLMTKDHLTFYDILASTRIIEKI